MKFLSSLAILSTAAAFQPATRSHIRLASHSNNARLVPLRMNVPLPSIEGGATPEEVKAGADKMAPPGSFYELQIASVRSAEGAIRDGFRLLEVEVRSCLVCEDFGLVSAWC
jgi:hypothetical protein